MDEDSAISDKKVEICFRSIMQRVSNDAIDEMIETGVELCSNNFIHMLAVKFEKYAELLAVKD